MAKHSSCIQLCSAILVFLIANLAIIIPTNCVRDLQAKTTPSSSSALFVFGDSLFDPGNNNNINTTTDFQANFFPYGETSFKYPTGRFCDGRVIPDFIAEFANLTGSNPDRSSYRPGYNFASGGAGALEETNSGLVISLKMQLRNFEKIVMQMKLENSESFTEELVGNAVYLFSIGSNDYLSPLQTNPNIIINSQYFGMVVSNITAAFQEIYKYGGRKFAILNLGPLGCLPIVRAANVTAGGNGDCVDQITDLAKSHNLLLSANLEQLQMQLKDFKYSYFDYFSAALNTIANPSIYGFKEVKSACCGSGPFRGNFSCGGKRETKQYEVCDNQNEHLFFDSIHPTQVANQLSAVAMWTGQLNLALPYTLQQLFQLTLSN